MALTNFVKNNVQGVIVLKDGAGVPNQMTLAFDRGDLSIGPLAWVLNELVKIERRGKFKSANVGARFYPQLSFSAWLAQFTDAAADVVADFMLKRGKFAGNVSKFGSGHPVYAIDLQYTLEGTNYGDTADHTFTATNFVPRLDSFTESIDGNQIAFSGEVLGPITGDLAVAEVT